MKRGSYMIRFAVLYYSGYQGGGPGGGQGQQGGVQQAGGRPQVTHNMRVTDLPSNKEIILPDELPEVEEAGLRAFGTEMMEVAKKYVKEHCDQGGNVKESNLTKTQKAGIEDISKLWILYFLKPCHY